MNITLPPALVPMGPVIVEFFEAMVHKLNVNSHKNALTEDDIDGLLKKLAEEVQEFREQRIQDASDPNILMELADTANFALLLYAYMRSRGVLTVRERFILEFFEIYPGDGVIACRKTRPGSPYKPGQAIRGHKRGYVTYIRAQDAMSGAMVSLPRRDIVWWAVTGKWPERPLKWITHPNDLKLGVSPDFFSNLELTPEKPTTSKYPFVFQYAPRGRENAKNFGKYGYQRRHMFKLIRVGYWDTEEDAAREGLKAWKEKTRGTV